MSYILDALRKSEHERERSALPGIADAPIVKPPPSKLPWILGGLGLLLALNVLVLLVVLLRPAKPDAPVGVPPGSSDTRGSAAIASSARTADAAATAGVTAAAAGADVRSRPAAVPPTAGRDVRPLTAEADFVEDSPTALDVPPVERDPTLDGSAAPVVIVPPRAQRPAAPARTAGVPSIDDLAPQATAGLPPLAINLHVYSPDPAQRFVVLNGRRYPDGAQLQEGPTLERITPDGVILNHRGLRFLLPRP